MSNVKKMTGVKDRKYCSYKINKVITVFMAIFIISGFASTCFAMPPYKGYNYSRTDKKAVASPQVYLPLRVMDGKDLGIGDLNAPDDIFISKDKKIYLLDSGNNRIICMDEEFKVLSIIESFKNDGRDDVFSNPQGIFVTEEEHIYIADTEKQRIVELDGNGRFVRLVGAPESDILPKGFVYKPNKLAVDKAGRLYAIGDGVFEGLMQFDQDGKFTGFIGANKVTFNIWDYFWKKHSTKEQKEGMELFIPTDLSNLDMDREGFIYATMASMIEGQGVKRLNAAGTDIIRKEDISLTGDLDMGYFGAIKGPSYFVDICLQEYGIYSCLDRTRGRIFTYDYDGNLLYVFGGIGNQEGLFKLPAAIESPDDSMIVLDKALNRLTVFELTDYGKLIKGAVKDHYLGKYEDAAKKWEEILKYNSNYDLAYIGVGKAYLRQKKYKEAMERFILGNNRMYFSKAFKLYRKEVLGKYFGYLALAIALAVLLIIYIKKIISAVSRLRYKRLACKRNKMMRGLDA